MNELFCKRLQLLLDTKNYTMGELAAKIGVSRSTVTRWFSGESLPSVDMLCRTAKCLGVSTDYLLGISNNDFTFDDMCVYIQNNMGTLKKKKKHKLIGLFLK